MFFSNLLSSTKLLSWIFVVVVVCMTGEERVLSHSEFHFPEEYLKVWELLSTYKSCLTPCFQIDWWVMAGVTLALELRISWCWETSMVDTGVLRKQEGSTSLFYFIDFLSIWCQLITESHLLNKCAQSLQLHFPSIFAHVHYQLFYLFEK